MTSPLNTLRFVALALGLAGLVGAAAALDLQGHRGVRGLRPENSLASFQHAIELGVSTLELDIASMARACRAWPICSTWSSAVATPSCASPSRPR